jgi:hypothetical protein
MTNKEKKILTICQAITFIAACAIAIIVYGWQLIPILILFGWANNIGITKQIYRGIEKSVRDIDTELHKDKKV